MLAEDAGRVMDRSKARLSHDWRGQVQAAGKETEIEFYVTGNCSASGVRKRMHPDSPDGREHPDLYYYTRATAEPPYRDPPKWCAVLCSRSRPENFKSMRVRKTSFHSRGIPFGRSDTIGRGKVN